MNTELSLALKMDRMIKQANQTTTLAPKVFKTATSQEMIDDYKRSLNKPIEIDGKLYKFHPPTMAVVLDNPNLRYTDSQRQDINPELYQRMLEGVRRELYVFINKKNNLIGDYWKDHDRLKYELDEEEKNLRATLKERNELMTKSRKKGQTQGQKKEREKRMMHILNKIEEIKQKISEINIIMNELKEKTLKDVSNVDDEIKGAEEKENATGEQYIQFLKEKDADEVEIRRVDELNKKKINDYLENLKSLNPRPINFSKGMNETDEDFLARVDAEIKEEANLEDDEEAMTQAVSLNRKKLLSNLDDITNDYNKKESIIGLLIKRDDATEGKVEPHNERIFEAVKYWEPIRRYIKRRYQTDSPSITPNDYTEMIKNYLNDKEEVERNETLDIDFKKGQDEKKSIGDLSMFLNRDSYSLVFTDGDDNVMGYFKGFHGFTNPGYANEDRILILAGSTTGEKGSFKRLDDEKKLQSLLKISKSKFKEFKDIINSNEDIKKDIYEQIKEDRTLKGQDFNIEGLKRLPFVMKLAAMIAFRYRIQDPGRAGADELKGEDRLEGVRYEMKGANRDKRGLIIGAGVATEKPNIYQKYGDILINIKKLNKNILAIKDNKERSIYGFPNKKISDYFADLVNMLIDNTPLNMLLCKALNEEENILFDQLIAISGTRKKTKKDINDSIKYLKNRYNVLSGSIEAGNDNPELIKDVKIILQQLYKMDQIKHKDIKELISNLENK